MSFFVFVGVFGKKKNCTSMVLYSLIEKKKENGRRYKMFACSSMVRIEIKHMSNFPGLSSQSGRSRQRSFGNCVNKN